ncbi:predicted protein [Nematostella vectensis]|uniref:Elp3/MiaA/NifB-like radical SAM core domain-containing protein n=1 Tax=Nematostella vectensis TaxID=45351 RepID=A7T8M8_NEMVE|nr:predicted protein [Nematostella vectensis]|eukprot:XP_001619757.1 hypothetical protein NEMVEDRAFT_v1g223855 [Nematostella vectensis]
MALFTVLAKGFSLALNTSTKKAEFHHNINTMQKNMLVTCSDGVKKQQFTCTEFVDHERMKKCLVKECKSLLEISGAKTINSVYFGGGTPSLAKPSTFSAILECLQQKGVLNPNAEVTLEANPTSAESHKLRDFKTAGINRLSLGVQSLSEDELAVLGRQGSCLESLKSLDMAKVLFPGRVSVDLMFGRPKQTAPEWERELEEFYKNRTLRH